MLDDERKRDGPDPVVGRATGAWTKKRGSGGSPRSRRSAPATAWSRRPGAERAVAMLQSDDPSDDPLAGDAAEADGSALHEPGNDGRADGCWC